MPRTYPNVAGPHRRAWLECAGDDVPPAQREPRQDPVRRGRGGSPAVRQGRAARRRARRTWPRPTAASCGRCCRRWASRASRARCSSCPRPARSPRRCSLIVGLGKDPGHVAVRRAAGAAARAISNASSVALALPADSPTLVRAVIEGFDLGGYTFTTYKRNGSKDSAAKGANTVSLLSRHRPPAGGRHRDGGRARRRPGRPRHPRLGQPARRRPATSGVRRRGRRGGQEARPRRQGVDQGLRREAARRPRVRRHPRASAAARPLRRGSSSSPTTRPTPSRTSPSSARASPTTRVVSPSRPPLA